VQLDRKLGQPLSEFVIGPELMKFARASGNGKDEFELLCGKIKILSITWRLHEKFQCSDGDLNP
jgi:hypothetical protein